MTSTVLSAPGELRTINVGRIKLSAQLTVDHGITITVWPTANAHDAIRFGYSDSRMARQRWTTITQLANTGLSPVELADTLGSDAEHAIAQVRAILGEALGYAVADDTNVSRRASLALQREIEALESEAERAEADALAARLRADFEARAKAAHGQCAADEQDEVDEAALLDFATKVGSTVAAGASDTDRPRTLAALAAGFAATHPPVRTLAEIRRERRRVGAR